MLACPKYINDVEERCLYRKLEMHWRSLAWVGNASVLSQRKVRLTQVKSLSLRLEMKMSWVNPEWKIKQIHS